MSPGDAPEREERGGQMAGQVVDFVTPRSEQRDVSAILPAETDRTRNISNSEAAAKEVEKSGPIPDGSEERRRHLYQL